MAYYSDRFPDTLASILKILIGVGIVAITISLVLLFINAIGQASPYWELQLAAAGCVIMVMAFLSLRIFERL